MRVSNSPHDHVPRCSTPGSQPGRTVGVFESRRLADHHQHGGLVAQGGAQGRQAACAWTAYAASHVLQSPRHARCCGAGDPAARRALVAGDDAALHASATGRDRGRLALLEARRRGGLEPVTTSARRMERRWRRPAITRQAWLEISDLASEPLRGTSPSEFARANLPELKTVRSFFAADAKRTCMAPCETGCGGY
jgi:hypothetical protein